MDKKILIIGLAGTIFLIAEFLFLVSWSENRQQELIDTFSQGYDRGLEDAIFSLYNQTENCLTVPIFIGNQSKYLIDLSCANSKFNP